jgi:Family of unknown function (DUF6159)
VGRIAAGWGLAKLSLRVVASDGSLSVLVVLGGIASGAVALAFLAPAAVAYSIDERWLAAIIGGLGVYLSTVAATYFAVALAAAAAEVLDGRDATVRGGMAVASRCVGAILGWALVLTTVNLVLQALRDRAGLLGNLLLGAAAVGWGLATLLVVPILALEGLGPFAALTRSTALFREKWGEQLAGAASIGVLFTVLGVVPAVVLMSLGFASGSNSSRSRCSSSPSSSPSSRAFWEALRERCSRSRSTGTRRAPARRDRSRSVTSRPPCCGSARPTRSRNRSSGAARASP